MNWNPGEREDSSSDSDEGLFPVNNHIRYISSSRRKKQIVHKPWKDLGTAHISRQELGSRIVKHSVDIARTKSVPCGDGNTTTVLKHKKEIVHKPWKDLGTAHVPWQELGKHIENHSGDIASTKTVPCGDANTTTVLT